MGTRVLVIDSDAAFSADVKAGFERLGAVVEVVDDGDAAVDRAVAEKPDLILLAIELRGTNGFLVCKRIKRTDSIKDVKLMILSSETNEEIFEQHKKLRTRADDYVHKPIAFDALVERARALVPIAAAPVAAPAAEAEERLSVSELEVDDSVELEEEALEEEGAPAPVQAQATQGEVDAEIDAFTDNAFGNLMMEDSEPTTIGAVPDDVARVVRKATPAPGTHTHAASERPARPQSSPPIDDSTRARMAQLEEKLEGALRDANEARKRAAEAERLEKEVADLKARAAKGGGVSSREFLELREGLNKKDKEILELRDQVTTRDRQLLETSDRALTLERGQVERDERITQLEQDLDGVLKEAQTAVGDKEAAQKRGDDFKTRLDRAEQKSAKLESDLDAERQAHATDVARAKQEASDAVAKSRAEQAIAAEDAKLALERATAEAEAAREGALASATAEHGRAISELRESASAELAATKAVHVETFAEMEAAHASADAAKDAAHASADAAKDAAHAALLAQRESEAHEAREAALGVLRAELDAAATHTLTEAREMHAAEQSAAKAAHAEALVGLRAELTAAHEKATRDVDDKHGRELAVLGRKLAETESASAMKTEQLEESEATRAELEKQLGDRILGLEKELGAVREELAGVRAELATRSAELESTSQELAAARAELASVREQLAARTAEHEATTQDLAGVREHLATKSRDLDSTSAELGKARTKIDGDAQILERARKAMAIGLGLLDDAQKNGV